jgi:hypothetical protein
MKALGRVGICTPTDKLTPATLIVQFERAKKELRSQSKIYHSLFSHADELSSFIVDIGGGSITNDLLKFYDCPQSFEKETMIRGTVALQNVSFSCLWDTTPEFLSRYLPREAAGEGLTSRILFATDMAHHNFDRVPPLPDANLRDKLDRELELIFKLQGEFKERPDATEFLNNWFRNTWSVNRGKLLGHGNFLMYYARKPLHLNKLSMIMAACRGSKDITLSDAQRALELLDGLEPEMRNSFGVQNISKAPDALTRLLRYIPYDGIYESDLIKVLAADGIVYPHDYVLTGIYETMKRGKLVLFQPRDSGLFLTRIRDDA